MENQTLNDTIQFVSDTISSPETIVNNAEAFFDSAFFDPTFFDPATLPLYLLGFVAFVASILDDWLNPKREFKPIIWYVQEFLYTLISIALGVSVCIALEVNSSISWIVAILAGLLGSAVIRTIDNKRDTFADLFVNRLKDKISNGKYDLPTEGDKANETKVGGDKANEVKKPKIN